MTAGVLEDIILYPLPLDNRGRAGEKNGKDSPLLSYEGAARFSSQTRGNCARACLLERPCWVDFRGTPSIRYGATQT